MMFRTVFLAILCCFTTFCSRSQTPVHSASEATVVQAWVSQTQLTAGDTLRTRCIAFNVAGARIDVPMALRVTPSMPAAQRGSFESFFTPTRAGPYRVTCTLEGASKPLEAAVDVAVAAGSVHGLRVDLGRTRAAAGSEVSARCVGVDVYGNAIEPPDANFSVTEGATLGDTGLRITRAGETSLSCRVPSWPDVAPAPRAAVQVLPGAPQRVFTDVDALSPRAHEDVEVRCSAVDVFGNVSLLSDDYTVTGPGYIEQEGAHFRTDAVGLYTVRCASGSVVDPRGIDIRVQAGPPAHWEAELDAPRTCYTQGKALPLQYRAWDRFGNRVQKLEVELVADPPHGLSRDAFGGFVLSDEADYHITLRALTPQASGARLPAYDWHIRVDSTPPTLLVSTPGRGAMVVSDAPRQSIVGTVHDGLSSISELFIEGLPQALPEEARDVHFESSQVRTWGLGMVQGWASDSCGNVAMLNQAYLSSPSFGPVAQEPDVAARVPHAVVARLSQPLWDDGARDSADDVATLLEMAIADRSLVGYLPEPLWASQDTTHTGQLDRQNYACSWLPWGAQSNRTTGYEIERAGAPSYDAPKVEYFRVVDDGWHVALLVRNLRVPVELRAYYDAGCAGNPHVSVHSTVVAPAFRLEFTAKVKFVDGGPVVQLEPTATHLTLPDGPPRLEGDWGILGRDSTWGLIGQVGVTKHLDAALNAWVQRYAGLLQNVVDSELAQHLELLLQHFLHELRIEHSLALPAPWSGGLAFFSGVDAVTLTGPEHQGSGDLALWVQVAPHSMGLQAPAQTPFTPPTFGPIRHADRVPADLQLQAGQTFALSVEDDLLNQVLFGLWYSGAFSVDDLSTLGAFPAQAGRAVPQISLFFTLPPVVMPSVEPNSVRFGLGDVLVEADLDLHQLMASADMPGPPMGHQSLHFSMYVSGVLDARLTLDTDKRHFVVTPLSAPRLRVQVTKVSDRAFQALGTHFVEDILNATLPQILATSLGEFPMPALQVGVLPGVPDGTVWHLSNGTLTRHSRATSTVLRGTLDDEAQ